RNRAGRPRGTGRSSLEGLTAWARGIRSCWGPLNRAMTRPARTPSPPWERAPFGPITLWRDAESGQGIHVVRIKLHLGGSQVGLQLRRTDRADEDGVRPRTAERGPERERVGLDALAGGDRSRSCGRLHG